MWKRALVSVIFQDRCEAFLEGEQVPVWESQEHAQQADCAAIATCAKNITHRIYSWYNGMSLTVFIM